MSFYFETNILAVLAAGLVGFLIGMAWYSNFASTKLWLKLMGYQETHKYEVSWDFKKSYFGAFWILVSYVIAHAIQIIGATTLGSAITFSFWAWLLIAATTITNLFFERQKLIPYLIRALYYLISIITITLILSALHFSWL